MDASMLWYSPPAPSLPFGSMPVRIDVLLCPPVKKSGLSTSDDRSNPSMMTSESLCFSSGDSEELGKSSVQPVSCASPAPPGARGRQYLGAYPFGALSTMKRG